MSAQYNVGCSAQCRRISFLSLQVLNSIQKQLCLFYRIQDILIPTQREGNSQMNIRLVHISHPSRIIINMPSKFQPHPVSCRLLSSILVATYMFVRLYILILLCFSRPGNGRALLIFHFIAASNIGHIHFYLNFIWHFLIRIGTNRH